MEMSSTILVEKLIDRQSEQLLRHKSQIMQFTDNTRPKNATPSFT